MLTLCSHERDDTHHQGSRRQHASNRTQPHSCPTRLRRRRINRAVRRRDGTPNGKVSSHPPSLKRRSTCLTQLLTTPNQQTRTVEGSRRPAERTYGCPADPHQLGCSDRHRPDRGPTRHPSGPGVQGLLLLGRPDPHRPRRHPEHLLADLPLRRPRRSRHARGIPRRRRHHPPRPAQLGRPRHQPRRSAAARLPGTAARTPRHPRLAARPPHPPGLRPLHPAGHPRVRLVGSRIELAAHARRDGLGMCRRDPARAHRQSALRRHRHPRLLRRPALLREGRRHSVRRLHHHRTPRLRHRRRRRPENRLAKRPKAVDRIAGPDRRLDRALPRRRRPGTLEPRPAR